MATKKKGSGSKTTPRKPAKAPKKTKKKTKQKTTKKAPQKSAAKTLPKPSRKKAEVMLDLLERARPDVTTALDWDNPLQLLVATILSAQCTDERVNQVTPALFKRYPTAADLASAEIPALEQMVKSTGFFRNKAKSIKKTCTELVSKHGGEVPRTMEAMVELPGVARKTANVVLGTAFNLATGVVVDTHVKRVSGRLGFTDQTDPTKIERDLMELIPKERWIAFGHHLVLHGRHVCKARKPNCTECVLASRCPSVDTA